MNKEVLSKCGKAADKIVNIVEGMGFITEKRLAKGELNALVTIEVRNLLNEIVTDFYNNAAMVPQYVIEVDESFNQMVSDALEERETDKNEKANPHS